MSASPARAVPVLAAVLVVLGLLRLAGAAALPPADAWHPLGPSGAVVTALAVERGEPYAVYAGTPAGLFRLEGGDWQPVVAPPGEPKALASVAGPPRLAAATPGGVYLSDDRATSWRPAGDEVGAREAFFVAAAPDDPTTLYAGLADGLYRGRDGGQAWEVLTAPLGDVSVLAHGVAGRRHYAVTGHGLVRSDDGGATWRPLTGERGDRRALGLAVHPARPDVVYAAVPGPDGGVFRSLDGGSTWARAAVASDYAQTVLVDTRRPADVYAGLVGLADGTFIAGVVHSPDEGATWSPIRTALLNTSVYALALSPRESGVLLAGTNGGGVFRYVEPGPLAPIVRGLLALADVLEPLLLGLLLALLVAGVGRANRRRARSQPERSQHAHLG